MVVKYRLSLQLHKGFTGINPSVAYSFPKWNDVFISKQEFFKKTENLSTFKNDFFETLVQYLDYTL